MEAPFRELPEYMVHVEKWYNNLGTKDQLSIYLASDEPSVINEARTSYPNYNWLVYKAPDGHQSGDISLGARSTKQVTTSTC